MPLPPVESFPPRRGRRCQGSSPGTWLYPQTGCSWSWKENSCLPITGWGRKKKTWWHEVGGAEEWKRAKVPVSWMVSTTLFEGCKLFLNNPSTFFLSSWYFSCCLLFFFCFQSKTQSCAEDVRGKISTNFFCRINLTRDNTALEKTPHFTSCSSFMLSVETVEQGDFLS